MKKMWKRFVSLLLACTLLAGMLPLSASAAEKPGEGSLSEWVKSKISELSEEDYTQAGPFPLQGSDLYQYTFTKNQYDNEGNLTQDAVYIILPGIGAANTQIPDYGEDSSLKKPWGESNASAVYIAKGVTGIGNHAFDGMTTLETLEIENPTSLKSVGDYAFNGCDKLVGPLDLSGVTDMGKYAFNGCERLGSGEDNEGVKLSDSLTEIPEYAFNGCGLKNVNIPTNCTEIGNNAFANNSLSGELNLPSSLITIGERAFYRYNSSSPTGGFSSITIPSSVMEIGANAFSGHKSLETVTLEHENKEKLTIENGAFGTDTYTAHNYLDSIKVGDITYENVSMGTQFLTKNNVGELLNNGVNCYLGDLKPLKFDHTDLPTCLTPGYRYYEMTLEGASTENEPIVVETKIEIPAPDHSYVECEDLPATCTQPERTHEHCTNLDKGLVRSCEEEEKIRIKEGGKRALGHNYVVTDIENPTIGAGAGDTVITYTCQNWSASEDKNLHDGDNISPSYSWKIEDKAVVGSTAHTLEELNLPVVQGVGNNYYAHLEWAVDDETLEAPLEDGTHPYNVKLVVTGAGLTFPECTGIGDQLLQVTVQVDKIKLDFSQVEFQNNIRYVAQPNGVFGVLNLPEDAEIVKTEYSQNGDTWAGEAPEETEGNVGKYQVRVTFSYTSSKYLLDTEDKALQPPAGYTLAAGDKLGTGTLTGPYEIKQLTKDDLSVSSIPGLTYNGSKRNTVRIVGLPKDAKVTVTWKDAEGAEKEEIHTATETSMDVAGIINAGTYDVTIKVEHETFANGSAEITAQGVIAKKSIPIPEANTLGSYTPEKVQIGVNDPTGEYVGIYTVDNNKQINAGTYEATAILLAPNNYKWSTSEGAAVNISYTIPRRVVQKPGVTSSTYTFTGQPIEVLYRTNQERLDGKYDDSGKLTAYWKDYDTEYVVYTATDVKKTDAGDYKVTVALNNKDANNYWWAGEDAEDYSFTWTINPQSINAPAVKVNNTTYDGQPYNTGGSDITLTGQSEVLVLGEDHKFYSNQSSSDPMQEAPTNAGTYYVQVDFDFEDGLKPENYTITGNNRQRFTIEKAELTLTAPTAGLEVSYTGLEQLVPAPEITGLYGSDTCTLSYSYLFTPENGEQETQPKTAEGELKVSAAGTYAVTVTVPDTCQNYWAEKEVTYTFRITSATQRVELESSTEGWNAEQSTVSKTLGDDPFTVTGKGYVGENETNAAITYESSNPDTASVDGNGQVTLKKATAEGEPVTITVTAAGSANYQKATATYTITVGKGTPTVEVQMPEGDVDNTYSYTGEALTFSATVTGAGNGAVNPTTDKKVTYKFYNNGEGDQLEGEALAKQPTGIGTYWVEAVYEGDDNYNGATSDAEKFTISPAALKVEATGYDAIYDGRKHDPVKSIKVTGVDEKLFTKDDYTISYAKKTDGQTDAPAADSGAWKTDTQVKDVADSGDYWIKVVIKDDDSYNAYIDSVNVDIDPKPLTVTKTVTLRKTYDGTTKATVDFDTITTGITGELVTADLVSAVYNSPNVEQADTITITYKLTADPETDTDLANYSLDGKAVTGAEMDETVTEGVGITPASITVDIEDQKKVYDGSVATPSQSEWSVDEEKLYDVDGDGTKDNLGITLSIDSDSDAKDAGAYAIIGKWTNSNYTVTFTGSWKGEEHKDKAGTYTITPRPIDVKIGDAEGFYGDAPDLTLGTKVILTPETAQGEEAGLVNGENIYGALEGLSLGSNATVSSSVGENYTIYPLNDEEPVLDDNGTFGNYNVTFTNEGTYTVKPRPITITIEDKKSDYGCDIAQLTYNGTLSNTYTGSNKNVVFVGDDEDELGITLSTTAKKGSDAGTYPISGEAKAESSVVSNYAITWKGENPFIGEGEPDSTKATYTVEKADLDVEFTNEEVTVSMGGTVNNPLKFINQSNSDEELGGQPQDVTVKYSSNDQGVATVNETTGEITLVGTGNATITAEVTSGGKNFTEGAKDSYIIHVAEDGGLLVTVTPKTLTYTGEMQNLISYSTAPAGAEVTFKVEAQTEGDRCQIASDDGLPQGQDAGTYRVSWVAKLQGYRDATGSTTVTIAKASPTTGFSKETVSVPYEENGTFDSTEETTLNVADDYKGTITYMSNDTRVASVQGNSLENISLNGTGSATITAVFTETDNYTAATASFRITVGTAETTISYTAEDYSVEYDRIAHGSKITVKSPSEYTIMYSDNNGTSYDLNESPTITDAGDLTIYFQIQADGYNSASGTQKVTVEPKEITANMVTGIAESYTYTGKEITFDDAISVHDEGVLLEKDKDYTITYDDNKEVGQGSVTITGRGNYKGSVTKNFTISPVDASDLTASLNRTFGYYGDSYTNNATVTVTHGSHTVTSDGSNTVSIAVKDNTGTDVTNQSDVVSINDHQTVTFNQVGTYTIEVTVTGNHETNAPIQLTYALLPVEEGKLVLKADNETSVVETYGDTVNGTITVTDVNGTPMTENTDYTLAYTYTPFEGTAQGSKPYDPSVMSGTPAAGMYVVTATGQGGYANSVGTFTFLILQRDLAKATLAVNDTDLVFNHDEKKPDVTVTVDGNAQPTKDTDYTITYYNNVNASNAAKAVVTATGNNFTGSKTADFTIAPKPITGCVVENIPDQYYTGNEVIPPVTIKDSSYTLSYTLILGYDYTTACANKGPGEATVTITGTGNYTGEVEKTFTIQSEGAPEPSERFDLAVTPSQWTWGDDLTNLDLSVTFGTDKELTLGTEYTLSINNEVYGDAAGETKEQAIEAIKSLKPSEYTITATGVGAYNGSTDTETVTIQKIQPEVTVTATPNSLSGGGKVTLTLKGEKLPAFAEGKDLSSLLTASAKDEKNAPDLSELEWETDEQTGVMTAELTLPNTNETYTFTLTFIETATHAGATDSEQVVVAQQIISGGGGGGPVEDQPADPDDTGVSDWLNTKDHLAYLAGYPGGTFGPDQNMTRAEAAQMFYNLLLEKDVEITVEFEDVPADAWYAKPVNTLASLGILSGVGNGRFDPERSITRAEFTVIAMKFANTSGGGVNIFSDVNEDDWFYSAVVDSTQYGWINGYPDGTFRPEATISRAEVTVIVNHMLGRAADRPYVIAHEEELNTFGDVNRGHWGYFHVAEATNAHEYHTEDGTESWTGLS